MHKIFQEKLFRKTPPCKKHTGQYFSGNFMQKFFFKIMLSGKNISKRKQNNIPQKESYEIYHNKKH